MRFSSHSRRLDHRAYSLIEVLAATGIIMLGIGAALSLSLATVSQEEAGNRVARGLSIQENAARLFRLGMSSNEIIHLLPPDPVVHDISVSDPYLIHVNEVSVWASDIDLTIETSPSKAIWREGIWSGGPGGDMSRRVLPTLTVYRPHTRAGY